MMTWNYSVSTRLNLATDFWGRKKSVGKLILVTAINQTPTGEGKSTITIGLADALNKIGKKTWLPSANRSLGQ